VSCCEVVSGEFVVAGCYASPVFEPAPEALDEVAAFVSCSIVWDLPDACGAGRDDGLGTTGVKHGADGVAVVAPVGDQPLEGAERINQRGGGCHVGGVAWREQYQPWAALFIGCRVELAGAAAPREADGLEEGPPFAPAAERCALMWVASIATVP
jgi:hypothetical protein